MISKNKFLRIPLFLVAAFFLLAGGFALALSSGPLAVGWMAPLIRSAIEAASPAAEIDFTAPVVEWDKDAGSLDLSVSEVVIRDAQGMVRVTLPRAVFGVSLRSLLAFSPAVRRIDLFEPEVEIVWSATEMRQRLQALPRPTHLPPLRAQNRRAAPAGQKPAAPANPETREAAAEAARPAVLPQALRTVQHLLEAPAAGEPSDPLLGRLESVRVHSANINMVESVSGARWQIRNAELEFHRNHGAPRLVADATLEAAGQTSRLVITTSAVAENQARRLIEARLENLDLGALAREVGLQAELKYAALPLSGEIKIEHVTGSGIDRITFALTGGKGDVDIPQLFPGPRAVDSLAIAGNFDLTRGLLRFESITLAFGDAVLSADATLDFAGTNMRRPDLKLSAAVKNLDVRALVEYWPKRLGRTGHAWVDANIPLGHIPEARIALHLQPHMWGMRPLPESAVRIDFQLENVTAFYLKGMPPIERGDGSGTFTTDELYIRVSRAEVDGIPLHDSSHRVDRVGYRDQQLAHTIVRLRAPVQDVLRLIDYPPLNYTTRYELPATEIFGQSFVVTELTYKPGKGLKPEDIEVLVEAQLTDLSYPTLLSGGGLTDGTLRMTITREGMVSTGRVKLNGADFHINWTQDFTPESEEALTAHYELTGELSGEDMMAFGVPAVPDVLDRAHSHLVLDGRGGQLVRGKGHVDLVTTGINSKRLSWSKPAGTPGMIEFDMAWTDDVMSIENISIRSPGIKAEASFTFDVETSTILTARVPVLKTAGHDLTLVSDFVDGRHILRIEAEKFDARAWLDGILSGEDEPEPPMDIELTAAHVMTMNGIAMSDVKLSTVNEGDYWTSASLSAQMDDGGTLDFGLFEDENGRHLTLLSDEAGRMAMGFGVFRNGSGGRLSMDAEMNLRGEPSSVTGEINIVDFRIVKSSGLAKAIVARTGSDVDKYLDGNGLKFRRFKFPFTFERGVVDITNARANGPQIGFTMRGQVNRSSGEMNIDGVIVPAYAFNSLLGNIPLVGGLLTGGKGGGLFALTYRMEGSMSDPDISVNPLSALAPGFLRKIFEGNKGKVKPEEETMPEPGPDGNIVEPASGKPPTAPAGQSLERPSGIQPTGIREGRGGQPG